MLAVFEPGKESRLNRFTAVPEHSRGRVSRPSTVPYWFTESAGASPFSLIDKETSNEAKRGGSTWRPAWGSTLGTAITTLGSIVVWCRCLMPEFRAQSVKDKRQGGAESGAGTDKRTTRRIKARPSNATQALMTKDV